MKRIITLLIGLTVFVCILTACGSNNSESESADTAIEETVTETSCDVSVDEDVVAELIQIENVEIPVGSTAADFMKAIEHNSEDVNYVSYDLNGVDLDVPGEYTAGVSVNIQKDNATDYVDSADIDSDVDTVNFVSEFNVTVTEANVD